MKFTTNIGLKNPNSDYLVFLRRIEDNKNKALYAAGLFVDIQNKQALLVLDKQDGKDEWARYKIPGGVAENVLTKEVFMDALQDELNKTKYPPSMVDKILKKEADQNRSTPERVMILEMVEETAYYPLEFRYGCDGYRYNRNTKDFDLWQVYFEILGVISPYSKDLQVPIRRISQVSVQAIDPDVVNMRVAVSMNDVMKKLQLSHVRNPHQDAVACIYNNKATHYYQNGDMELSKLFALAAQG